MSVRIHSYSLLCLLFLATPSGAPAGETGQGDPFLTMVREAVAAIPPAQERGYVVPTDAQLDDWRIAINLFRAGRYDSCRSVLARYNYALATVRDPVCVCRV